MNQLAKVAFGVDEAASAASISRSKIYKAINAGDLRSFKEGHRRLVSRQALEEFIARKEAEAMNARKVA